MFCTECGSSLHPEDRLCSKCGTGQLVEALVSASNSNTLFDSPVTATPSRVMIHVIPVWKMVIETKGTAFGIAVLAMIPMSVIASVYMFLDGRQSGDTSQAIIGLLGAVFFGLGFLIFIPRQYTPGKSFPFYRKNQEWLEQYIKYGYVVMGLIAIGLMVLAPKYFLRTLGGEISGLIILYVTQKSLKHHADVDFVVNEYLAHALGIGIGEKVLVSYQNFDAEDLKRGSNAFAASATKLVAAAFDGKQWTKLSHSLNQITQIGITSNQQQTYFVKIVFADGNETILSIGLYDKLTSTPGLVIRKLLEAIDASIAGTGAVREGTQRRRVVVNADATAPNQGSATPVQTPSAARSIDLTPAILEGIKNAEQFPGRRLEL